MTADIDRRLRFLSECVGIGPWLVARKVKPPVCLYRGQPEGGRATAAPGVRG